MRVAIAGYPGFLVEIEGCIDGYHNSVGSRVRANHGADGPESKSERLVPVIAVWTGGEQAHGLPDR